MIDNKSESKGDFTNSNLREAEKDYISRWNANAKQHFEDGDYEWICNLINESSELKSCHRIFEIGCGAGYSTLMFAIKDFAVVSIDINEVAISSTKKLLEEYDYDVNNIDTNLDKGSTADVCLWKVDLIHQFSEVRKAIMAQEEYPIDLIVLCNPGGQLTTDITKQEYNYLVWGGFTEEEICSNYNMGNVGLLHKWAMIYSACGLAQLVEKPLLIVERGERIEIKNCLQQIQNDTGNRKVFENYKVIRNAPEGGIKLSTLNGTDDEQYWGVGLYYPC